ncbi:Segregation and condensation protein A (plasmid) [Tsukamurella tyrosinosolvens]|uniref:Segregation and condensation protein A n=2 Tax=Tsukamurella tyrosinosolvens TaxID=57704 RepID=A0A1H4W2K5_TSUTY|nr:condensin subunit ScpA [Tsukamurella tyrosinosolvens]VEH90144.1 Segregation and condensation protein A [Tsukamurella tyrosinosolvens]
MSPTDTEPIEAVAEPDQPEAAGSGPDGAPEPQPGFTVKLANFEGPFDLLLQLIGGRRLDVTEVALHIVTDEFIAYTKQLGAEADLDQTTEFLVVAATLLDLKAARLLPAGEVEDADDLALLEARDLLFARLLQYRAYKQVAELMAQLEAKANRRYPRAVGLEPRFEELVPPVQLGVTPEQFALVAASAFTPKPKPTVGLGHLHVPKVSVPEQARLIAARLRERPDHWSGFSEIVADCDSGIAVIARFLALLELYRERAVLFDQPEALGDLKVRWSGENENVVVGGTRDEYDETPGDDWQEER